MTTEDLAEYVQDDLFTYFDKQGEHEFLEEAENYWGDMFGEVIDEVQDYMKCDFKREPGNTVRHCLLYTSPSPRDVEESRMPSSA